MKQLRAFGTTSEKITVNGVTRRKTNRNVSCTPRELIVFFCGGKSKQQN